MSAINILILTTSFPLAKESTSGLFVKRFVDNLASSINPIVVAPYDNQSGLRIEYKYTVKSFFYAPKKLSTLAHRPGGIPAALQSNKLYIFLLPLFLLAMLTRCFIEAKNVDLIHANWSICGVIGGIVGKFYSIPTITTIRGEDGNRADTSITYRIILKTAIYLSTHVVAVSESLVEKIAPLSKNSNSKIIFIPNGVDQDLMKISGESRPNVDNHISLLTVGSLTANKNITITIDIVSRLIRSGKNITLNVVGDGPQKALLEKKITKLGLSKNIFLLGGLQPSGVYSLMRKSNVLILSSYREGRPNVILESMLVGAVVVASRIDGVSELIEDGHTGLLFDPYDANELYECICKLYGNRELQESLSSNAAKFITQNKLFWDETARKYCDLYKRTIGTK